MSSIENLSVNKCNNLSRKAIYPGIFTISILLRGLGKSTFTMSGYRKICFMIMTMAINNTSSNHFLFERIFESF